MEQEERQWQIGEIPWHCILQMEWISEQKTRAEKKTELNRNENDKHWQLQAFMSERT